VPWTQAEKIQHVVVAHGEAGRVHTCHTQKTSRPIQRGRKGEGLFVNNKAILHFTAEDYEPLTQKIQLTVKRRAGLHLLLCETLEHNI